MWHNIAASADRCLGFAPRRDWIAPEDPDPIYLNLYDRFYAMMRDMAVTEHLAFAFAYGEKERYFEGARAWLLASARVWRREAEGAPDANKAYAVTRILKGLAVGYDILHEQLSGDDRDEVRGAIGDIAACYHQWYLDNPGMAGPEQNKHHGSVEAASFGVAALAVLGELPDADRWLDLAVKKHTDYLLPCALEPSGTQEQSSNFWASTMHYRIFFLDALRRVTGQDLFEGHESTMSGRIALAAVAGPKEEGFGEAHQSVLFGPVYGQLDYWSPVLLYLAREFRRPIYQHLALWDRTLGSIQESRFATPTGEELPFAFGGYAYAWYDPTVPDEVQEGLPLSFEFADVNEAYVRSSYEVGGIVAGMRRGTLVVHAGGRPVMIDEHSFYTETQPVEGLALTDDGQSAALRCGGAEDSPFSEQTVVLSRPHSLLIERRGDGEVRWWCHGKPHRDRDMLCWPDGTMLRVTNGDILSVEPEGHFDEIVVGMGKLKCVDAMPVRYPLVTARPGGGVLRIEVTTPQAEG